MGLNRSNVNVKAPKGSGGVGLFFKKHLCKNYKVDIIDNSFDGILGVNLQTKYRTMYLLCFPAIYHLRFSCYLPPESSP